MAGSALFSITATGTLTGLGDGFMTGSASFSFSAYAITQQTESSGGIVAIRRFAREQAERNARIRAERIAKAKAEAERLAELERIAAEQKAAAEAAELARLAAHAAAISDAYRQAAAEASRAINAAMRPAFDVAAMNESLRVLRAAAEKAKKTENKRRAAMLAALLLHA